MLAAFIRIHPPPAGAKHFVERFPAVFDADRPRCRIEVVDGTLVVRDLGQGNVRVNGCGVVECPLLPGDQLAVGDVVFRVVYERLALGPLPSAVYSSDRAAGGNGIDVDSPPGAPAAEWGWEAPASEQH